MRQPSLKELLLSYMDSKSFTQRTEVKPLALKQDLCIKESLSLLGRDVHTLLIQEYLLQVSMCQALF